MSRFGLQIAAHLNSDENQRSNAQLTYQRSVDAARDYDGSEASEQNVYTMIHAFEACAREIADRHVIDVINPSLRDELELAVASAVATNLPTLSVDGLLGLAIESFGRRLQGGTAKLLRIATGFHFLPGHGIHPVVEENRTIPFEAARIEPRTELLIQALNQNGIYTDDILVFKGADNPQAMRQSPYTLIQIPRLDREILISDAVEEATFISIGQRGAVFWATYSKEQLAQLDGVIRLVNIGDWAATIIGHVLHNNPPGPKKKLTAKPQGYRLTEDIILTKALEYAASHQGKMPTLQSGEVEGLPGQSWQNWSASLKLRINGLKREGISSLPALFRQYGLKIDQKQCPEMIARAITSLRETGRHGLVRIDELILSEDIILRKALEYAASHDGNLPSPKGSSDIEGFSGQSWGNWNYAIRYRGKGLTREGLTGITDLFRLYGLMMDKKENPAAIRNANEALRTTGAHGLKAVGAFRLTEDLILTKALEYAAAHDGKLPNQKTGEVNGLPGQVWGNWGVSIRTRLNSLTRKDQTGLTSLFRLYGLLIARKENPIAIANACKQLSETGSHGLKVVGETRMSEDFILTKALQFAIANDGKLPTRESGEVDGLPGQDWANWELLIYRCGTGMEHEGLTGLPGLFRLYGLKIGRVENRDVINTAIEKLNATGSHGLQPVGEIRLSEDLLLRKALAFAAAHAGKLPTQNDGEVEGFPGQTWGMWSQAIRNKSNGLTRNGLTGIGSLFRACGLKTGRIENSEPVKQAWERLQNEGHHGLSIGGDPILAASRPDPAGSNLTKAEPSV